MKLIHTALAAEARPLMDRWSLKQVSSSRLGSVYRDPNRKYVLLVSGTGALKTATAVGALLATEPEIDAAMNVGICGCPWTTDPLGSAFLIHQIKDVASNRSYYPDMLGVHPWKESALETHGRAVTTVDSPQALVDMEASGFFCAARNWLAPHRIAVLKIVSDYLEGGALDKKAIEKWIHSQVDEITDFLEALPQAEAMLPPPPAFLTEQAKRIQCQWALTATQLNQLQRSLDNAYIRGRTDWTILEVAPLRHSTKFARNRAFRALMDELESKI